VYTRAGHDGPDGGVEDELYSFNLGARWDGWLIPHLGHLSHWKETQYPFYRRLGGPRVRLDRCTISCPHQHLVPGPTNP